MYLWKAKKQFEEKDEKELEEKRQNFKQRQKKAKQIQVGGRTSSVLFHSAAIAAVNEAVNTAANEKTTTKSTPEELPDGSCFVNKPTVGSENAQTKPAGYIGTFSVQSNNAQDRTKYVHQQLKQMKNFKFHKNVNITISVDGVSVASVEGNQKIMSHALHRISYGSCDPENNQFAFLAREPKGKVNVQFCHVFVTTTSQQAEELNSILGNAFKIALVDKRVEKQPTFNDVIKKQLDDQKAIFKEYQVKAEETLQKNLKAISTPTPFCEKAMERMEKRKPSLPLENEGGPASPKALPLAEVSSAHHMPGSNKFPLSPFRSIKDFSEMQGSGGLRTSFPNKSGKQSNAFSHRQSLPNSNNNNRLSSVLNSCTHGSPVVALKDTIDQEFESNLDDFQMELPHEPNEYYNTRDLIDTNTNDYLEPVCNHDGHGHEDGCPCPTTPLQDDPNDISNGCGINAMANRPLPAIPIDTERPLLTQQRQSLHRSAKFSGNQVKQKQSNTDIANRCISPVSLRNSSQNRNSVLYMRQSSDFTPRSKNTERHLNVGHTRSAGTVGKVTKVEVSLQTDLCLGDFDKLGLNGNFGDGVREMGTEGASGGYNQKHADVGILNNLNKNNEDKNELFSNKMNLVKNVVSPSEGYEKSLTDEKPKRVFYDTIGTGQFDNLGPNDSLHKKIVLAESCSESTTTDDNLETSFSSFTSTDCAENSSLSVKNVKQQKLEVESEEKMTLADRYVNAETIEALAGGFSLPPVLRHEYVNTSINANSKTLPVVSLADVSSSKTVNDSIDITAMPTKQNATTNTKTAAVFDVSNGDKLTKHGTLDLRCYQIHERPVYTFAKLDPDELDSEDYTDFDYQTKSGRPKSYPMLNLDIQSMNFATSMNEASALATPLREQIKYENDVFIESDGDDSSDDEEEISPQRLDSLRKLDRSYIEDEDLRNCAWYQPGLPRNIALELLQEEDIGCFIVRDSTTHNDCYALSVNVPRYNNPTGIAHYLILRTRNGVKLKGLNKAWPSLTALVIHHTVMREMLPCTLRLPHTSHNPAYDSLERTNSCERPEPQTLAA